MLRMRCSNPLESIMSYIADIQDFTVILDFIRFCISQARAASLYYGHGTDNAEDDIYALVWDTYICLGTLMNNDF